MPELDIGPHEEKEFTLTLPPVSTEPGVEYWLNLSFVLKSDMPWAGKGHELSWEQFRLPVQEPAHTMDSSRFPPLAISDQDALARFSGPDFALSLDKQSGLVTQYFYRGTLLLERGPRPDFWRAMTDNDKGARQRIQPAVSKNPSRDITIWREQGADWKIRNVEVQRIDDRSASVTVSGDLISVGAQYTVNYTIYGSGDVIVDGSYIPGEKEVPMMPRFGMELILAPGFENTAWYGRGPAPTYVDRNYERVGIYNSTVDDQWNEFSKPQENSNKVDVRWVALTNREGMGLLATGSPLLSVSAYHFPKDEIESEDYTFKMTRRPQIYLNLDLKQMGVGGVDSWTPNAYPLEKYRIRGDEPYSYRYRLTPVSGDFSTVVQEAF